jgi:hypothetical protein
MIPGAPERRSHDYARHGTTGRFAAFNIAGGTVIHSLHRHHRAAEFKKFLTRIDKAVPALEAGIRAWIESWNQSPRPFAWTKTADEILDSLASYLARISGAGY